MESSWTRRDFHQRAVAALALPLVGARGQQAPRPSATVRGVKIGAITGVYGPFTVPAAGDVTDVVVARSLDAGIGIERVAWRAQGLMDDRRRFPRQALPGRLAREQCRWGPRIAASAARSAARSEGVPTSPTASVAAWGRGTQGAASPSWPTVLGTCRRMTPW